MAEAKADLRSFAFPLFGRAAYETSPQGACGHRIAFRQML
jgi:hypothetical protein